MKLIGLYGFFAVLAIGTMPSLADMNISFVEIGNPGNAADTNADSDRIGRGSVGYAYRIGVNEVSWDQFSQSGIAAGSGASSNSPVVGLAWVDAARYCNWLTSGDTQTGAYQFDGGGAYLGVDRAAAVSTHGTVYALPTEDEWYKAAYFTGSGFSQYANGTDIAPGISDSRYGTNSSWLVTDGATEQNGTKNMMGNVLEWLETEGTLRGGSYSDSSSYLRAANRFTGVSGDASDTVGFRVIAIPEPGTISLMSISTLGLFFTRTARRRKRLGKTVLPVRRERLCDTYCSSVNELLMAEQHGGEEGAALMTVVLQAGKARVIHGWSVVLSRYRRVDRLFWNRMVAIHERRVAKRQALRDSFKKKTLAGFDAFLALIMK